MRFLAILLFLAVPVIADVEPEVGKIIPNLHLANIDGKTTKKLWDFRGKKILLIQFASW